MVPNTGTQMYKDLATMWRNSTAKRTRHKARLAANVSALTTSGAQLDTTVLMVRRFTENTAQSIATNLQRAAFPITSLLHIRSETSGK
jgi:hypothetical protein